jgi:hypothetical protein
MFPLAKRWKLFLLSMKILVSEKHSLSFVGAVVRITFENRYLLLAAIRSKGRYFVVGNRVGTIAIGKALESRKQQLHSSF